MDKIIYDGIELTDFNSEDIEIKPKTNNYELDFKLNLECVPDSKLDLKIKDYLKDKSKYMVNISIDKKDI